MVIVMVITALIVLLCTALLQMAATSERTQRQGKLAAEAKANARLSLSLAIAQLQKEMGPDQRISAPAAQQDTDPLSTTIENVKNPRYTGVWKAGAEPTNANMSAKPPTTKATNFQRWLISGRETDTATFNYAAQATMVGVPTARTVIGGSAVVNAADEVRVPVIDGPRSGFAWWTSDNGQKATIRSSAVGTLAEPGDVATVLASSRRFDPKGYQVLDPMMPPGDSSLPKVIDLPTADLAGATRPPAEQLARKYFHDLTCNSEMLPVDVTTGKLKRCMNLRMAWLQDQPDATRVAEGTFGPPTGGAGMNYTLFSWDQLRSAMAYTQDSTALTFGSTGRPRVTAAKQTGYFAQADEKEYNPNMNRERWRLAPVPVKVMYIVSASTDEITSLPAPKNLALRLNVYPVITLWNPYNVDLVVPEYSVSAWSPPWNFQIEYGAPTTVQTVNFAQHQRSFHSSFGPETPADTAVNPAPLKNLVIPAGENRVLYPAAFNPALPGNNRGDSGTHPEAYVWMSQKPYDLATGSPPNYGLPFMNLKGSGPPIYPNGSLEVLGASADPVKISVSLAGSTIYELSGEHTDGHANSGIPGQSDRLATSYWHSFSTAVDFTVDPTSPQVAVNPAFQAPPYTFGGLRSSTNGGQPIMIFSCHRKTLDEKFLPNKCWSFSMPSHPFHARPTSPGDAVTVGYESGFTYSMKAVSGWGEVAAELQQPPSTDQQTYMGSSYTPAGQLRAVAQEIPVVPVVSLAQFQHLPLFDYKPESASGDLPSGSVNGVDFMPGDFMRGRAVQFPQNNAIGNSYASPGIAHDKISGAAWPFRFSEFSNSNPYRLDRSYVANKLLWDAWWCSSMAPQNGPFFTKYGSSRSLYNVADQFVNGVRMLPNEAFRLNAMQSRDQVLSSLFDGNKVRKEAEAKLAAFIRINGGFNVNSASEKAWEQLFAQMLSRPVVTMGDPTKEAGISTVPATSQSKFHISRYTLGVGDPAERSTGADRENRWWDGSRELTSDDIKNLAKATVQEVKKRGPFLSLADFVNRSLVTTGRFGGPLNLKGTLQTALDSTVSKINEPLTVGYAATEPTLVPPYPYDAAATGALRQGIPGWVTQADLLQSIGPVLSARSDTFTIRSLGELRDGNGKVLAKAWCEAVVQRNVEYVDTADSEFTAAGSLLQPANKAFGRRMNIVSFRWLDNAEVN